MHDVTIEPLPIDWLGAVIGSDRLTSVRRSLMRLRRLLGDRTVWTVNSTSTGGGVAEMLPRVLGYQWAAGIRAPWMVIGGDEPFFALTKRLHHCMHGSPGDGGPLGPAEHQHYRQVLAANTETLLGRVRPGDIAVLHDPQVAALAGPLRAAGLTTIWRCHVGADVRNDHTQAAWSFLRPYLESVDAFVFSRPEYVPFALQDGRVRICPPTIDPLSPKNQPLRTDEAVSIVSRIGLVAADDTAGQSDTVRRVRRTASITRLGPPVPGGSPLIVQVSRWDPLKDPIGVMEAFVRLDLDRHDCYLALVGPDVSGVSDDPEGREVLAACVAAWEALPPRERARIHLVSLPMDDPVENALMVNAIQRHAAIVVQKSLAEGFGLTVTEAMWKAKPVLASAVGGIRDQIDDGVHGYLLAEPTDPDEFAATLDRLLDAAPGVTEATGRRARSRVGAEFLDDRQLLDWAAILDILVRGHQAA
ncbi:MAG: glycosyltransferase [Acidimicrobiia bacterium]